MVLLSVSRSHSVVAEVVAKYGNQASVDVEEGASGADEAIVLDEVVCELQLEVDDITRHLDKRAIVVQS